jgi:mRNA-degrading endonuclease RelE of RelBE toxin-antitoxin system
MKKFFIIIVMSAIAAFRLDAQDYPSIAGEYCNCYKKLSDTISSEFQQMIIRVAKSDDPRAAFAKEMEKLDDAKRKQLSEQLEVLGSIMDSQDTEAGRCGLALDKKYKKYCDTPSKEKEFNKKLTDQLKQEDCEFFWAVSVFAMAFSDDKDQP